MLSGNKDQVPDRRICLEEPAIDFSDGLKVRRVIAVDRALDDLVQRGPRGLQALLHLLDDNLHLFRNWKSPHLPCDGIVGWHLRNVDEAAMRDDK
jgi:hypothetical protein